jgi:low temperature requirement protein LtrA
VACAATPRAVAERSVRVSTLELFFDLVFVFTITQLTGVLVDGEGLAALVQVVVMLLLIWWMYDGYAWLTNAIATDRLRFRLLLVGGMGGFLVIALAIPNAYDGDGLAFGLAYLVVVLLHAGMFVRGTSVSEVRAILRIAPFNLLAVVLVLAGGAVGGVAGRAPVVQLLDDRRACWRGQPGRDAAPAGPCSVGRRRGA